MSYPDDRMRTLLGWPLRRLASAFALLWLVVGVLPTPGVDALSAHASRATSEHATLAPEAGISLAIHASEPVGLLSGNAGAELEVESEEEARDSSAATLFVASLCELRDSFRSIEARDPAALRLELASHRANRAPPLA